MSAKLYKASKWQQAFHDRTEDEVLGAGSAGPGKSLCLLFDGINQALIEHARCLKKPSLVAKRGSELYDLIKEHPLEWGQSTGHAIFMRRTSPRLLEMVVRSQRMFPRLGDDQIRWDAKNMTWHWSSGFRFQFGHCVNRDDWQQYYGSNPTWIGYDEAVEFEENQCDQINTRMRSDDPVLSKFLRIRYMTNPVQQRTPTENYVLSDPFWVRRKFVDPAPQGNKVIGKKVVMPNGEIKYATRIYLPAKLTDNPNKQFVEQYMFRLASSPAHIRKALLDGDWYSVPGSYFGDVWDTSMHVCRPFKIPADWPQFRAMDWGFKMPGCVGWFAMDPDGNLYLHREMTFKGKEDRQVAIDIKEIEKDMGLWAKGRSRLTGPADTQLWEERGDKGRSKAMVMAGLGVRWVQANKRSRVANAMRLHKRLNDHQKGTTTPGFVVFENCVQTIKTMPAIQVDPGNPEEPAKGGEDHHFDMCSYAVEYADRGPSVIQMAPPGDKDEPPDEEDRAVVEGWGRDGYGSAL